MVNEQKEAALLMTFNIARAMLDGAETAWIARRFELEEDEIAGHWALALEAYRRYEADRGIELGQPEAHARANPEDALRFFIFALDMLRRPMIEPTEEVPPTENEGEKKGASQEAPGD